MTRKITTVLVLGLLSLGGLVLMGCQSSSSQPHSPTGTDEMRSHSDQARARGDWKADTGVNR